MTTRNALRTLLSIQPGFGQREINGELGRLGFAQATTADLAAIGGYVESVTGVWALPEHARSTDLSGRIERGAKLEAHSHRFSSLGFAGWQAERNSIILRWIKADARVARMAA